MSRNDRLECASNSGKNEYLLPSGKTNCSIISKREGKFIVTGRLEQMNNVKLLVCSISGSNFSISLNNNEEYDETDPWNLWKRYNAPRTMGSGFKILQNATLKAVYRESVFGNGKFYFQS